MNIAQCIHGLGLGGAQQVVRTIAGMSDRRSFRHYVYCTSGGALLEPVERTGATVRIITRTIPKFDPLHVVRLSRAMRADGIDVVHTHLFGDSLHGALAARRIGSLPVMMTLHADFQSLPAMQRLGYRWLLPHSTRVVACSESVGRSFAGAIPGLAGDMRTIRNGAPRIADDQPGTSRECKQRLGVDAAAFVIGAVGRLVHEKGFRHLVQAFAGLCRDGRHTLRLALVGAGPLRAALEQEAHAAGVLDRVTFAGARLDMAQLWRAFDVVVFSSTFEGLPVALIEAMSSARCIVATDVPAFTEALRDRAEALIVPKADAGALRAALADVVGDDRLRERLAVEAQRRYAAEFAAEQMVAGYEELYHQIHREAGSRAHRVPTRVDAMAPTPLQKDGG